MKGLRVLKLGGHLLYGREGPNFAQYVDLISRLAREHKFHIVVGGGRVARIYIEEGRKLGVDEGALDLIGIAASWLNARLLQEGLRARGLNYILPRADVWEIKRILSMGGLVVVGGLAIGQSTTATAAVLAEMSGAEELIYATNVEGVYNKDPRRHPDAKLLKEVTVGELRRILARAKAAAGTYPLFDEVSLDIIERAGFRVVVVDGRRVENIEIAMRGGRVGTLVLPGP